MSKIWNYITYLGLGDKSHSLSNRNVVLANRLNSIMIALLIILSIITTIIREINHTEFTIHTKKLLVLLVFCLINITFSYYKKHNLTKIILVFIPSFVLVFMPILLGYVQEIDFVYNPLIIIALSFVPQLILKPSFSNKLYCGALIYFLLQVIFLDNILINFSKNEINFFQSNGELRLYYKIVLITVFIFITSTMFYLRKLNYDYEVELQENNEELKATIEELKVTQQQLVLSEKMASLGVLTAGVAHEINNPLNFISAGVFGIENYFKDNLNDHVKKVTPYLNAINEGIYRAANIVTSLNHYNHRDDLPHTICKIHDIINNCLIILNNQFKNRITIHKNYTNESAEIFGSDGKLHQAMLNIIGNAEQAIEDTGEITITTKIVAKYLEINIADNGCGISNDNMKRILDPFFSTKEPGKGTGLGLSITYNIILEHQGILEFESELGKGTNVIIKLPISKEEQS